MLDHLYNSIQPHAYQISQLYRDMHIHTYFYVLMSFVIVIPQKTLTRHNRTLFVIDHFGPVVYLRVQFCGFLIIFSIEKLVHM